MPSTGLDAKIDHLYQLPLDEFTSARNALAKEAGSDGARVKALVKPAIPAWAVNQLYWRDRDVWEALIAAAENARRAHKAVLSGRSGDVRAASKVHEDAVETALKATLALLADGDHPATDATKQAIATTLRALPGDEPPGRLTRALQPGGFEMLAGLSPGRSAASGPSKPAPKPAAPPPSAGQERSRIDAKALTRVREAVAASTRALREAEQAVRRDEFEIARLAREEERAEKAVEQARAALTQATSNLEEAEAAAKTATRRREAADSRSRTTQQALTDARRRAEAADAELKKMERG